MAVPEPPTKRTALSHIEVRVYCKIRLSKISALMESKVGNKAYEKENFPSGGFHSSGMQGFQSQYS